MDWKGCLKSSKKLYEVVYTCHPSTSEPERRINTRLKTSRVYVVSYRPEDFIRRVCFWGREPLSRAYRIGVQGSRQVPHLVAGQALGISVSPLGLCTYDGFRKLPFHAHTV